jgi:co-chaperonin GroES (HSP10)
MKLDPKNGWVQVDLSLDKKEEEIEKSLVALPEDYKPAEKPYKVVSVVKDPDLGKKSYKVGDVVVVPTHVIREVEIRDNKFYLVERNHILAVVSV